MTDQPVTRAEGDDLRFAASRALDAIESLALVVAPHGSRDLNFQRVSASVRAARAHLVSAIEASEAHRPAAAPDGDKDSDWLDHLCRAVREARGIRLDLEDFDGDKRGISAALGEAEDQVLAIAMRAPDVAPTDPGHGDAVKALQLIAAFDDEHASERLRKTGSYGGFDEPGSVRVAREALATIAEAEGRQP